MKTITELFETSVKNYPNNPYLWEKSNGKYQPTSYQETHEKVHQLAAGLFALGVKKGDRMGLVSDGRNDWIISELGMLYAGAINVPLSVRLESSELVFRLKHSGSTYVFVSKEHASKVEAIKKELPELKKIVYLDRVETADDDDALFLEDIQKEGAKLLLADRSQYDEVWRNIEPDDIANISYTSGTTADPKGIMLSHLNYVANVIQSNTLMDIDESYKTLAILPWDHAFAHTTCLYCFMINGASIASVEVGRTPMETLKNIPKNINEVKPQIMMSVPAYSKAFRKNIEAGIRKKGKFLYSLFQYALKVGYRYNGMGHNRGKGWRAFYKPQVWLFNRILFQKVRDGFGGNIEFFIGGGALLDTELQKFFYAIGMPVCQGYGLTEASPVISSNSLANIKFGSSGKLVKYMDLKIMNDEGVEQPIGQKGEIVIKGDNVMLGYWNNPDATSETIKDGWLYTGDMGYMGSDGFLYVLGRFKSLLISNDGEKYSPEGIEEALIDQSKIIDQAMLYNNQNPYTVGMVVPNIEALKRLVKAKGVEFSSEEGKKAALQLIQNEIENYKSGGKYEGMFPERWLPAAVAVLPEAFTQDNHMLNFNAKMVRGKVCEYFAKELEFLYTPEAKKIENKVNIEALSKWE